MLSSIKSFADILLAILNGNALSSESYLKQFFTEELWIKMCNGKSALCFVNNPLPLGDKELKLRQCNCQFPEKLSN